MKQNCNIRQMRRFFRRAALRFRQARSGAAFFTGARMLFFTKAVQAYTRGLFIFYE